MRLAFADAYIHSDGNGDCDGNAYANVDANGNGGIHSDCNGNAYANSNSNSNCYNNGDCDRPTASVTDATAASVADAASLVPLIGAQ